MNILAPTATTLFH